MNRMRSIAKHYNRIYAHVYYSHYDSCCLLGMESLFNQSFSFYLTFIDVYSLVSPSDLRPLHSLMNRLVPNLHSDFFLVRFIVVTQLLNDWHNDHYKVHQGHSTSGSVVLTVKSLYSSSSPTPPVTSPDPLPIQNLVLSSRIMDTGFASIPAPEKDTWTQIRTVELPANEPTEGIEVSIVTVNER